MDKNSEAFEVMHSFADCLRTIYQRLGLAIPEDFYPDAEADRILSALGDIARAETNGMRRAAHIAAGSTTTAAAAKQIRNEALRIDSIREEKSNQLTDPVLAPNTRINAPAVRRSR